MTTDEIVALLKYCLEEFGDEDDRVHAARSDAIAWLNSVENHVKRMPRMERVLEAAAAVVDECDLVKAEGELSSSIPTDADVLFRLLRMAVADAKAFPDSHAPLREPEGIANLMTGELCLQIVRLILARIAERFDEDDFCTTISVDDGDGYRDQVHANQCHACGFAAKLSAIDEICKAGSLPGLLGALPKLLPSKTDGGEGA